MKLKKGFYTHQAGNAQVMVGVAGTGFSGIFRSNETAAFIVDQLKNETTEDEIVKAILAEYDATEDQARRDVRMVLGKLREISALEE
ncbi:MAG: PqqD family protein [Lachnospiraceae bacterium]|nr:PqqD family protein [Lachnospiraceae bacterium]